MTYYRYGFILLYIASAFLFFAPIPVSSGSQFGLDKVVHASIFAGLVYCGLKAFPQYKLLVLIFVVGYGFAVEYIQGAYFPLRYFDWHDISADLAGTLIGSLTSVVERVSGPKENNRL